MFNNAILQCYDELACVGNVHWIEWFCENWIGFDYNWAMRLILVIWFLEYCYNWNGYFAYRLTLIYYIVTHANCAFAL